MRLNKVGSQLSLEKREAEVEVKPMFRVHTAITMFWFKSYN